jgi:hypothetical protein
MLTVEFVDSFQDAHTRTYGALGVVAMGKRSAEQGHHCITDELLKRPAVLFDSTLPLCAIKAAGLLGHPQGLPDPIVR